MKRIVLTLCVIISLSTFSDAEYYKCVTSSGKTIFTDSPPPDAKCEFKERINSFSESSGYINSMREESDSRIQANEEKRAKVVEEKNAAEEDQRRIKEASAEGEILSQYQTFNHDGFEWKITNVRRFSSLGSESNPQKPSNGTFIVVELQLKNISSKPRYYGKMTHLSNGTQYPQSSMIVYAKEQLGYDYNSSTIFEPGSTLKTYEVFDAGFSSNGILLIEERGVGSARKKVKISM